LLKWLGFAIIKQPMKKLFIIANWKSHKNAEETKEWMEKFTVHSSQFSVDHKEVIICPPFTMLSLLKSYLLNLKSIKIGSQNISPFEEGAYTGEITAKQVADFAEYAIIGHSERRTNFFEDEEMLSKKIVLALANKLTPIFCVQSAQTAIPQGVSVVAYEPVFAIGSGHADTPESADKVAAEIKEKNKIPFVLYGGSVEGKNVNSFTQMAHIDGVLVGGASLDVEKFAEIIKNA